MSHLHNDLVSRIRLFISEIGGHSLDTPVRHDLVNRQGRPVKIGTPGQYDVHACVGGKMVAIDAKTGGDTLKRHQRDYGDAVRRAGGVAFAARSVEDVRTTLTLEGLIDVV